MSEIVSGFPGSDGTPAPRRIASASWYRYYVLTLLCFVGVFASLDRVIAGVLLQPIKNETGASDTAMGLLVGFTFSVFYAVLGIPIARWCDVGVRKNILALGLALWSALTVAFGMAHSFFHLALCRMGVAVGEATAYPATYSLIGDYFSKAKRATAIAIFTASLKVGSIGGVVVSAWLAQKYGWRTAFISLGVPGVLLALLMLFTVLEPKRGDMDEPSAEAPPESFSKAFVSIVRQPIIVILAFAMAFGSLPPLGAWMGPFFLRVHGLSLVQMAISTSLMAGLGSMLGTLGGGFTWSYLARRGVDEKWLPRFVALAYSLAVVSLLVVLLHPRMQVILPAYIGVAFFVTLGGAPTLTLLLNRASPHIRALTTSLVMMVVTFADGGVGPALVGALNDALNPYFGDHAVRYSLMIVGGTSYLAAALLMIWAGHILARSSASAFASAQDHNGG